MHLLLEQGFARVLVPNLDVLALDVLLNGLHNAVIFESGLKLNVAPVLLETLDELALHKHEDTAYLPVRHLGGQFDLIVTLAMGRTGVPGLGLRDVLRHDLVVETDGVLASEVVIELAALWRDHVALTWLGSVAQIVARLEPTPAEELFVLPSRVLLLDQAHRWASMSSQVIVSCKLAHYLIEAFQVIVARYFARACRANFDTDT